MARPIWSGSISFGLVNIPIKLFNAVSRKGVSFNQIDSRTGSRVKMQRVSAADGSEVPYEAIVKGYELSPDRYVLIEPDELDSLDPEATHTIDIEEFVHLDQIDPIYFERSYYLVPDDRSAKAYRLLTEALADSDKVAIARFVLRTKQYLAAVRAVDGVLVVSTMLYADEVVPPDSLGMPETSEAEVSERELKMARQLVDSLTVDDFDPDRFSDEYREKVLDLIERKAAGEVVVAAAPEQEPAKVVDLLAALEASVAAAKAAKAGAGSEPGAGTTPGARAGAGSGTGSAP